MGNTLYDCYVHGGINIVNTEDLFRVRMMRNEERQLQCYECIKSLSNIMNKLTVHWRTHIHKIGTIPIRYMWTTIQKKKLFTAGTQVDAHG
jgi:hypothetical protein